MSEGLEEALQDLDVAIAERGADNAVGERARGLTPAEYEALEDRLAPWRLPTEVEALYRWSSEAHDRLFGRSLVSPTNLIRWFMLGDNIVWIPSLFGGASGSWGGVELGFDERPAKGRLWWVGHGASEGELLYSSIEHFVRTMTEMVRRSAQPPGLWKTTFDDRIQWDFEPEFYDIRLSLADGPVHARDSDHSETLADIYSTPYNGGEMEFGWPRRWYDLYEAATAAGATRGLNPFE